MKTVAKDESLVSTDIFTRFESAGVSFLLVENIKAKIGFVSKTDKKYSSDGWILPFISRSYAGDPSIFVLSASIIDMKKHPVVWRNEIFQRKNITEETVLINFIEELFKSI